MMLAKMLRYPAASLLLMLAISGCRDQTGGLPIAPVMGVVTLDGRPLPAAVIRFQPEENLGTHSSGVTDANGHFELKYTRTLKGAIIGTHVVSITTGNPDNLDAKGNLAPIPEILPAIYHRNSILKETVVPKTNHIELHLTSQNGGPKK